MGNDPNLCMYQFKNSIFVLHGLFWAEYVLDKGKLSFLDIQRQSTLSQNEMNKREAQIQRAKALLELEQAVLQHRSRLIRAQEDIMDVRRSLSEIRERLNDLS